MGMLKVFPAGREEQFGCLSAKNVRSWENSQVPWCHPRSLSSLNLRNVKCGRNGDSPWTQSHSHQKSRTERISGLTFHTLLLAKAISSWESQCCYQIPGGLLAWIRAGVVLRGCPDLASLSRCFFHGKFDRNKCGPSMGAVSCFGEWIWEGLRPELPCLLCSPKQRNLHFFLPKHVFCSFNVKSRPQARVLQTQVSTWSFSLEITVQWEYDTAAVTHCNPSSFSFLWHQFFLSGTQH